MKQKNLPLSLVLISIALGMVILIFTNNRSKYEYSPRVSDSEAVVSGISPSAEYLSLIRSNQTTGLISPADLGKVQNQLKDFNNSRSIVDLTWRQLGPDNFGGRTRAIMFDNQDPEAKTIFAAGVTGGIWKSDNLGISWLKINNESYNLNVSCMKQDASGTIYAGTGESFNAGMMSGLGEMGFTGGFVGQGIFKSTNGDNFTLIGSTQPQYNSDSCEWAFINELAVNLNNGRLYAATNTGLKYSDNGGDSWFVAKDTSGTELSMNSLDVQVSSDGAVVACVDNLCYISPSGNADAFVTRSTGDSISLPAEGVTRIEFAFAPSDANVLYASVINSNGSLFNMYLSDDKGLNWRIILPGSPTIPIFLGSGVYDNALTVFPGNSGMVLLGGVDAWLGTKVQETGFYAWESISTGFVPPYYPQYLPMYQHTYVFRPGSNNDFFIGSDGGVAIGTINSTDTAFETSNRSYFTTQFYNVGSSGVDNYVVGGSQGNGTILITGHGNTTKQGEQILGNIGTACVISLIDKNVLVASVPGANLLRSNEAGANYSTQFVEGLTLNVESFNTPMALWENFDNPNSRDSVWFFNTDPLFPILGGTRIQVRSNNSGQPFYYITPLDITIFPGDSILVRDVVSSRYFIASSDEVYMTSELHNFGKTPEWFEISNSTVGFTGSSQCISYSSDANHLFVGTIEGKLYRISNLALAYNYDRADVNSPECIVSTKEIIFDNPNGQVITSIAVDPADPSNVMITLGNYGNDQYVFFSDNALDETPVFSSRQGNLPQMPVYSSLIEMTNTDMGIIGTEHGIFVTEDIHANSPVWMRQDSLMGSVPVFQLQQQIVSKLADTVVLINGSNIDVIPYEGTNNFGVIYAASYGRGLLRCNIFEKPVGVEETYTQQTNKVHNINIYPNPITTYATIELESYLNSSASIFVYDLAGRKVLSLTNNVKKGMNKIDLDLSSLNNGSYFIQVIIGSDVYSQKFIAN